MTSRPQPPNDKFEMSDFAAELVQIALAEMMARENMPAYVFLAGAHAAIITMLVEEIGGPMTADSCTRAAKRVRDLPSRRAVLLAAAPPAGTA